MADEKKLKKLQAKIKEKLINEPNGDNTSTIDLLKRYISYRHMLNNIEYWKLLKLKVKRTWAHFLENIFGCNQAKSPVAFKPHKQHFYYEEA